MVWTSILSRVGMYLVVYGLLTLLRVVVILILSRLVKVGSRVIMYLVRRLVALLLKWMFRRM